MTQTAKYSSDVETMTINDGGHSWERQRTSTELKSFIERHIGLVGELDTSDYEVVSI